LYPPLDGRDETRASRCALLTCSDRASTSAKSISDLAMAFRNDESAQSRGVGQSDSTATDGSFRAQPIDKKHIARNGVALIENFAPIDTRSRGCGDVYGGWDHDHDLTVHPSIGWKCEKPVGAACRHVREVRGRVLRGSRCGYFMLTNRRSHSKRWD
jgi:hypothetical protein